MQGCWEVNEVVGHFGGLWHPIAHKGVADNSAVPNSLPKGKLKGGVWYVYTEFQRRESDWLNAAFCGVIVIQLFI